MTLTKDYATSRNLPINKVKAIVKEMFGSALLELTDEQVNQIDQQFDNVANQQSQKQLPQSESETIALQPSSPVTQLIQNTIKPEKIQHVASTYRSLLQHSAYSIIQETNQVIEQTTQICNNMVTEMYTGLSKNLVAVHKEFNVGAPVITRDIANNPPISDEQIEQMMLELDVI